MPSKYFQYILDNPDKDWDWFLISQNPNITIEDVTAHPNLPWNWCVFQENLDLPWNWAALSTHPELTWEYVKEHPTLNWCFEEISAHKNITWDIVKTNKLWNHPDKTKRKVPWSFRGLSKNSNITPEIINVNLNNNWSWKVTLLDNPNISWEFIHQHIDKLDIDQVSRHKAVNWEIIQAHPEIKWNPYYVSQNPNITWDIVQANRNYIWKPEAISPNKTVTIKIVKENRWFRWNMYSLADNPNTSCDDIFENPDIFHIGSWGCMHPYSFYHNPEISWHDIASKNYNEHELRYVIKHMSGNPNVSWEIINAIPSLYPNSTYSSWCLRSLMANPMSEPIRKRQQARCLALKEEIIAAALHPKRVEKWIEYYGINWDEYI